VGIFEVLLVPEVRHEMILGVDFWAGMGIVPNLRHLTWEFTDSPNKACSSQQITSLVTRDDLSSEQRSRLKSCVNVYFDSTRDSPLGGTDLISHKIVLLEDAKLPGKSFYSTPHRQGGRRNVKVGRDRKGRIGMELALSHGAEKGRHVPVCN
jgi:hypothetical protein